MASKKIKNELREKLTQSIQEVVSTFNEKVGDKIKKSAIETAKKISNKFAKAVKELDKAEKKANKKIAKKQKKATKAKLKAEKRAESPVAKAPKADQTKAAAARKRAPKTSVGTSAPNVAAKKTTTRKGTPKAASPAPLNGRDSKEVKA